MKAIKAYHSAMCDRVINSYLRKCEFKSLGVFLWPQDELYFFMSASRGLFCREVQYPESLCEQMHFLTAANIIEKCGYQGIAISHTAEICPFGEHNNLEQMHRGDLKPYSQHKCRK